MLARLDAGLDGLSPDEVRTRLTRYGPNRLPPPKPVSRLRILVDQFRGVVVLLLVAAAVTAFLIGDILEAAAIAAVLAINAAIGYVVELRARRAMESLLQARVSRARVVRDGAVREVDAGELVPGDVIAVESGDAVPADARLLSATEVRTVEASLTGESVPVGKRVEACTAAALLADRKSMLYTGTTLASGTARAVVVATGTSTELGRVGALLAGMEEEATPLERRLDALGRRLVWLTLGIAALIVALGAVQGVALGRMIETGIALAIAAVPEGLPTVATIALAVGLTRMARRKALVRRLNAVEALGSTTVVCSDKTGTLTAGEMTVTCVRGADFDHSVSGTGFTGQGAILEGESEVVAEAEGPLARLLEAAVLTNRATIAPETGAVSGDPTDAALLVLGRKGGVDPVTLEADRPRRSEIPFSSERKLSASVHGGGAGGAPTILVKGAPDAILPRCARVARADGDVDLDAAARAALEGVNESWAASGLRVIGLASGTSEGDAEKDLADLTFLGLVGIMDPPAPDVRETIAGLRDAGIRVVMITGDQRATAEAVGRDLGILEGAAATLDGRDLQSLTADALAARVGDVGAYSRVAPEDKLKIVMALQSRGEIVAMLGDGVNDAPALKKADVGVAMGHRGTDVAKQAASVVLQDDRFPTIAVAVEEGRVIFDNIRKFVFYLFSCNLAEVLVLLAASLAGLPLPLLPLQILWLNLVTDTFPALALAMEPGEEGVMRRPPRDPDAGILSPAFLRALAFYALLITGATLATYVWALESGRSDRAVTISFMTLALAQLFHLGNARSRGPVWRPRKAFGNRWAVAAVPLVVALQLLAVYWPPLATVLRTTPLTPVEWAVVVAASILPAVVGQITDTVQERRA